MSRIHLSPPHVGTTERERLLAAFDSNWIAPLGPELDGFERDFSAVVRVPYSLAVSSGTAALHLALVLLGIEKGDRVVTSTLTFAATANAISYVGAEPVFVDSERTSWNMDPELLVEELAVSDKAGRLPKAVIAVDLYGQCADYDRLLAACARYDVPLVEDAAEALGATYRGKPAGSFGAMAAFSFNGNKIVTTGGGGMLVSHRGSVVDRARYLATQARRPAPHYEHDEVGYNYRLSNLLGAVGRGQLASLPERVAKKRAINATYRQAFADLRGVSFMPESDLGTATFWLSVMTVDSKTLGKDREAIRLALEAADIESRPVWKPMHLQPAFSGCRVRGGAVAADLFERGLCLPSGTAMDDGDLERVIRAVREAAGAAA